MLGGSAPTALSNADQPSDAHYEPQQPPEENGITGNFQGRPNAAWVLIISAAEAPTHTSDQAVEKYPGFVRSLPKKLFTEPQFLFLPPYFLLLRNCIRMMPHTASLLLLTLLVFSSDDYGLRTSHGRMRCGGQKENGKHEASRVHWTTLETT